VREIDERQADGDNQDSDGDPEGRAKLPSVDDGHAMVVDSRADSRLLNL
jgi:hypothetical protein